MTHLDQLRRLLRAGPVMAQAHILMPVALDPEIRIEPRADSVAAEIDGISPQLPTPILIQTIDLHWANRFTIWRDTRLPDSDELNRHLAQHLSYVRGAVRSQSKAGAELARRFIAGKYDCGFLMVVDGLSYSECVGWAEMPEPCFVDGPSVTEFGFLQIIQESGLVSLLLKAGYYHLRGYSYWERSRNDLAARMFTGISLTNVRHFSECLTLLQAEPLDGRFVFIVRQGLDEYAHRQRELPSSVRTAVVNSVHADFESLVEFVRDRRQHALIALLADHGIAWRDDRHWQIVGGWDVSWHGRYSERPPSISGIATSLGDSNPPVYCYHPGLLCREPRSNEAGFHGGLSFEESFVPFALVEV